MAIRNVLLLGLLLACSAVVNADHGRDGYSGNSGRHGEGEGHQGGAYNVGGGYNVGGNYQPVNTNNNYQPVNYYPHEKVTVVKYVATHNDWYKCKKYVPVQTYKKCDKSYKWEKKVKILTCIHDNNCYAHAPSTCCGSDGYEYKYACIAKCFDIKTTPGSCSKPVSYPKPVQVVKGHEHEHNHYYKVHTQPKKYYVKKVQVEQPKVHYYSKPEAHYYQKPEVHHEDKKYYNKEAGHGSAAYVKSQNSGKGKTGGNYKY